MHGEETVAEEVSGYYVAEEVTMAHRGMMIAIPGGRVGHVPEMAPAELADVLVRLAWSDSRRSCASTRASEEAEAQETERGQDQTRGHREDPESSSSVYEMMPPKGWGRESHRACENRR